MILFEWKCSGTKHDYKGLYYDDKNDPTLVNNITSRRSFGSKKIMPNIYTTPVRTYVRL
jgi:hypothetical protein